MATTDGEAVWRSRRYVDIHAAMRHRDRRNARGLRSVVICGYEYRGVGDYYEVVRAVDYEEGRT